MFEAGGPAAYRKIPILCQQKSAPNNTSVTCHRLQAIVAGALGVAAVNQDGKTGLAIACGVLSIIAALVAIIAMALSFLLAAGGGATGVIVSIMTCCSHS